MLEYSMGSEFDELDRSADVVEVWWQRQRN